MMNRWVYSDDGKTGFRLLNEFSCSSFIAEVHTRTGSEWKAVAADDFPLLGLRFRVGDRAWDVLYIRRESDSRGAYSAVALQVVGAL